jgi:hypothetical protein
MTNSRRRLVAVLGCALALSALTAGVALATTTGLIDQTQKVASIKAKVDKLVAAGKTVTPTALATLCGNQSSRQVFLPWGDAAWYTPAPGGSLEDTTNWTLNTRASIVPQNNSFSSGTQSLFLGQNGQAISPAVCVSITNPTIRFFMKNSAPGSTLKVSVIYEGLDGNVHQLKLASLTGGGSWQPSLVIPFHVNYLAEASSSGITAVAFQFDTQNISTINAGGWTIDDLYVDPIKIW